MDFISAIHTADLLKFAPGKGGEDLTLGSFKGYGAVFNNRDSQGDILLPGAFKGALGKTIPMMFDHFAGIIGKITPLEEDSKGLVVEGELTQGVQLAAETYALLKHGAVTGLSIRGGLNPKDVAYDEATNTRTIKKIDPLREVSVVVFPANAKARVGAVKSLGDVAEWETLKEFEAYLRDAGYAPEEARKFVSLAKSVCARDALFQKQKAEVENAAQYNALADSLRGSLKSLKG